MEGTGDGGAFRVATPLFNSWNDNFNRPAFPAPIGNNYQVGIDAQERKLNVLRIGPPDNKIYVGKQPDVNPTIYNIYPDMVTEDVEAFLDFSIDGNPIYGQSYVGMVLRYRILPEGPPVMLFPLVGCNPAADVRTAILLYTYDGSNLGFNNGFNLINFVYLTGPTSPSTGTFHVKVQGDQYFGEVLGNNSCSGTIPPVGPPGPFAPLHDFLWAGQGGPVLVGSAPIPPLSFMTNFRMYTL
jgi:hypothetical protein